MAEEGRTRWTDGRLDDLAERVDDVFGQLDRLASLPERVARVEEQAGHLVTMQQQNRQDVQGLRVELADDVKQIRRELSSGFDRIDKSQRTAITEAAAGAVMHPRRSSMELMKDTLAVVGPVIVALIAAYATIQAAGSP